MRQALEALQDAPDYRPGDYEMPIASIHQARFVPFDGDTRLLFATSFDGPWDAGTWRVTKAYRTSLPFSILCSALTNAHILSGRRMSDHISGPRALAEPIADITDFYAFPGPEVSGRLVLGDEHTAVRGHARSLLARARVSPSNVKVT